MIGVLRSHDFENSSIIRLATILEEKFSNDHPVIKKYRDFLAQHLERKRLQEEET
jgi:hypothetical protein